MLNSFGYGSLATANEETLEGGLDYLNQNAPQMIEYSKIKLNELEKYAKDGHYTWRVLALFAGLSILALGITSVISDFFRLSPFDTVLDIYLIFFGAASITLEYKEKIMSAKYLTILHKQALFLFNPYGRAVFYIFIGVLILVKGGLVSFFVGLYTAAVGIIIYYNSTKAFSAINALKRKDPNNTHALNDGQIAQKFYSYDKDNDGYIDAKELNTLCTELGYGLSESELTTALFILDKNDDGKISMEEFKSWWSGVE